MFKKIICSILIIAILSLTLGDIRNGKELLFLKQGKPIAVEIAEAVVPTTDIPVAATTGGTKVGTWANQAVNFITSKATWMHVWKFIKDTLLRMALERFKQKLLSKITDELVAWISGEKNKPQFVTNWKEFLGETVNETAGQIIENSALKFLCSPFYFRVKLMVLPVRKFPAYTGCRLSDIQANMNNFYRDFREGGWVTWEHLMITPQDTVHGAWLVSWDVQNKELYRQKEAEKGRAESGKGFLSLTKKECATWEVSEVSTDCNEGTGECTTEEPEECTSESQPGCKCLEWDETQTTPGEVVAESVNKVVGTHLAFVENIVNPTDLAVLVTAVTNALVNRLMKAGAEGLLSIGKKKQSEGYGYGAETEALIDDAYQREVEESLGLEDEAINDYLAGLETNNVKYAGQILDNKKAQLIQVQSGLFAVNEILPVLYGLYDCCQATSTTAEFLNSASSSIAYYLYYQADFSSKESQFSQDITIIENALNRFEQIKSEIAATADLEAKKALLREAETLLSLYTAETADQQTGLKQVGMELKTPLQIITDQVTELKNRIYYGVTTETGTKPAELYFWQAERQKCQNNEAGLCGTPISITEYTE